MLVARDLLLNVGSINDSGINVKKCARRNGFKLQSANNARSKSRPRLWAAVKPKPFAIHGRGLFRTLNTKKRGLC